MANDERIQTRIDAELKASAEAIFAQLGISSGEAIRMYYAQVAMRGGIPFDVVIPEKQEQSFEEKANQFIDDHQETLQGLLNR